MIQMNELGPGKCENSIAYKNINNYYLSRHILHMVQYILYSLDAYSTLDERGRRNTLDNSLEPADKDAVQVNIGCTHTLPTHMPLHDRTQMTIL